LETFLKYLKIRNNTTFRHRAAQFQLLLPARSPRADAAAPQGNDARPRRFRPVRSAFNNRQSGLMLPVPFPPFGEPMKHLVRSQ
jgi:hypothetical protein